MFKSKEFKAVTTMVFVLFSIAILLKLYYYNRAVYAEHIAEQLTKNNRELICINVETKEAYKTRENPYQLLKVKTPCFNELYEYKVYFINKNKAFDILDCNVFK